jgi:putative ABC transport system ATP-binding protein
MPVIEVNGLTKDYVDKGQVTTRALRGVELTVERGEFMAIAGPSGSGKTTLLNLIGALDAATSGTIRVDGHDIGGLSQRELSDLRRDRIGFVFQAYNLIPVLTAAENAEYVMELKGVPAGDRRRRIAGLFERMEIKELMDTRPLKMSGGQQQRVAIARSLVNDPSIILADEPTGALDSRIGIEIMAIFQRLNREEGITMIVVTHDPDIAAYSNRSIHFKDGKLQHDERLAQPREAQKDLEQLPAEQPEEIVSS